MSLAKRIITSRRTNAAIAFTGAIALSFFLLNWPNLREYRQVVFVDAALEGNVTLMKLLLFIGADANGLECQQVRCRTPLIAATQTGQHEAVQLLLARGADVDQRMKRGQTPLMFASYYGHTELVRLFLANGADVNADFGGDTALTWAKQKRHAEVISLLVANGANRPLASSTILRFDRAGSSEILNP